MGAGTGGLRRGFRRRAVVGSTSGAARVVEPAFSTYVAACEGSWRGCRRRMEFSALTSLVESMDGVREEAVDVDEVWRACGGRLEGIAFASSGGTPRTLRREGGADGDVLMAMEDGSHVAFRPSLDGQDAQGIWLDFALTLDGGRRRAVAEVRIDGASGKVAAVDLGVWNRGGSDAGHAATLEPVEDRNAFDRATEAVRAMSPPPRWVVCTPSGGTWSRRTFEAAPLPTDFPEINDALFQGLAAVVHVPAEGELPALGVQATPQHNFCSRGDQADHSVLVVQFTAGEGAVRATLDAATFALSSLACLQPS